MANQVSSTSLAFVILTSAVLVGMVVLCALLLPALIPILLIPAVVLQQLNKRLLASAHPVSLDRSLRFAAATWWPGLLASMGIELVLTLIFGVIFLMDQIKQLVAIAQENPDAIANATLQHTFGYYLFVFATAFIVAGVTEECCKLLIVRCTCCRPSCCAEDNQERAYPENTLYLFLVVATAFSTAENVLYTFQFCSAGAPFGWILLEAAGRVFISLPLHLVCAAFTAVNMSRRDLQQLNQQRQTPIVWCILPAVVIHGFFDFQALILADSSILPMIIGIAILVIAWGAWARRWKELKAEAGRGTVLADADAQVIVEAGRISADDGTDLADIALAPMPPMAPGNAADSPV